MGSQDNNLWRVPIALGRRRRCLLHYVCWGNLATRTTLNPYPLGIHYAWHTVHRMWFSLDLSNTSSQIDIVEKSCPAETHPSKKYSGIYVVPKSGLNHQLAFFTPGILPSNAFSRN